VTADEVAKDIVDAAIKVHRPLGTAADLSQVERLVIGIDYQLERDPAARRHPARGPKPS
jgi:hypothetical protein